MRMFSVEAKEETSLEVKLIEQFHSYSDPRRDPRHHTISTVFIARASGTPKGADDAAQAALFTESALPAPIVFDHAQILRDYFHYKKSGERPKI
jgi:8-oxo-dGTP diphosphatase